MSTNKPDAKTLEAFGKELDTLREETLAKLGQEDADYIRGVIKKMRWAEVSGRALIHFSINPLTWAVGVGLLSTSKILENMEIGHNVMHGQYDWMNDPSLSGNDYEWDNVCDGDSWRHTHNYEHHTFTNILGKDRDYGYDLLRLSDEQEYHPSARYQMAYFAALTFLFQWGVGAHELEIEAIRNGEKSWKEKVPFLKSFAKKSGKQLFKDYVFFPALAGPWFAKVAGGNLIANGVRNVWSSAIIFCGHFPDGTHTFTEEECENESRGHWYYRQILGSANIEGGELMHIMSGNLSHQIEHHLFPDIPAWRYGQMAPEVKRICEKYGIAYNSRGFFAQYGSVLKKIWKYSRPPRTSAEITNISEKKRPIAA